MEFVEIAKKAKNAALQIADLDTEIKNQALNAVADNIEKNKDKIFEANKKDLQAAEALVNSGEITKSTFNRLKLDENKMRDMVQGIRDISKLDDPVNKKLLVRELDEGLTLYKISCPIGVLGIIFEARPDVIAQISALAIKSANAVILKGGKESINTNKTILSVINSALEGIKDFPKNVISQVFTRDDVAEMLKCDKYINLIIPRGGNSLVKFIKSNTSIPVLGHADGICHIFVDESAPLEMAQKIVTTKVSGIMYDKSNPSAILNIEGADYLVRSGDVINGYKVLSIGKNHVTVQKGSNVYKAGVGQLVTEGQTDVTYNQVANLNKKFGGGNK